MRKAGDRRGGPTDEKVLELLFLQARDATSKVALAEVIGEIVTLVEKIGGPLVVAGGGVAEAPQHGGKGAGLEERLKDRVGTLTSEAVKALQGLRVDLLTGMNTVSWRGTGRSERR